MLALAIALQVVRDRAFAHTAVDKQVLYVSDAEVMRRAALSYDTLLADVYWIRALQHYGGERQKPERERRYDLLYPLLDMATTLDPRFTIGYRFGAIFLAEPHPGGAGRPDLAIALLKKGVAFNPNKWDTTTTSASSITGTSTTTRMRLSGSAAAATCRARRSGSRPTRLSC